MICSSASKRSPGGEPVAKTPPQGNALLPVFIGMNDSRNILAAPVVTEKERILFHGRGTAGEVDVTAVLTLVLWSVCLSVGVLGIALPYPRPRAVPAAEP